MQRINAFKLKDIEVLLTFIEETKTGEYADVIDAARESGPVDMPNEASCNEDPSFNLKWSGF